MCKKLLLFCLLIVSSVKVIGQSKDIKRLIFGLNAGVKFANKNYARRYTGVYQDQLLNFFTQQDNYQRVRQLLDNKDFSPHPTAFYSDLFRFQPAPVYGVNIGFQASKSLCFEADLNFSNIKFIGGYTLLIQEPGNLTSQEVIQNGTIIGKESRFNGRINMNYTSNGEKVKAIIGISGILNSWRMEDNSVELNGGIITNLYSQFNTVNGFLTKVRGTGFGYGANIGIEVPFKKGIVMQILYQPYRTSMEYFETDEAIAALGDNYIKPSAVFEHDLIARFVWR
ncbi:MAG: hypothetical protein AB8B74_12945 [Crocinitomicaceae bacterium]